MKIDWRRKLSSRKFWAALAGFTVVLLAAFGVPDMTGAQIASVISAVGVLAVYILGEGIADASAAGANAMESAAKSSDGGKAVASNASASGNVGTSGDVK